VAYTLVTLVYTTVTPDYGINYSYLGKKSSTAWYYVSSQVNGRRQISHLTNLTSLNRESPSFAHVITSTISAYATFGQDCAWRLILPIWPKLPLIFSLLMLKTSTEF